MLKGKKILIGITGSIAAYKIPFLVRLLIKEGAEIKIIMTESAKDFVTPLTLSTLSGNPVYSSFFEKEDGRWHSHIELGNWAEIFLVAPTSANSLAKMANGIADNLLTATYLAARCPIFIAPAMDVDMFLHPTTAKNIEQLKSFGNVLIEPAEGELASGLCGAGRLQEPEKLIIILKDHFKKKNEFLGINVLITAGPTFESVDPVRFIGNYSSGLMGYHLAEEFANRGAMVNLVSGLVKLKISNPKISVTKVISASEMHHECMAIFPRSQIVIMAAAVADYAPSHKENRKIKKNSDKLTLHLKKNTDILFEMGKAKKSNQFLAGFALETNNEFRNARSKLKNKNLDLIVLNSLKDEGAGFGTSTNKITMIGKKGKAESYDLKPKAEVASDIADKIKTLFFNQ